VEELLVAKDATQIRTAGLHEETLQKIRALIRADAGEDAPLEVSSPTQRLEDYFLGVVEEAQRERLATAGAERGTVPAAFLGAEEEGREMIEQLVQAGQREEVAPPAGPEPVAAIPLEQDRQMIDELVKSEEEGREGEGARAEPAAAVAPESVVRHDVLDELIDDDDSKGGQSDEG
jgi:hypothetical protein